MRFAFALLKSQATAIRILNARKLHFHLRLENLGNSFTWHFSHDLANAEMSLIPRCERYLFYEPTYIYVIVKALHSTEGEIKVYTWLREISSCSCLTVLLGPAWVLLSKTYKPLFVPLYKKSVTVLAIGCLLCHRNQCHCNRQGL